jgi:hypothetical protein
MNQVQLTCATLLFVALVPFATGCAGSAPPPAPPPTGATAEGAAAAPAPTPAPPPEPALPDDPGELAGRCEKNEAAACAKLGGMFARGEGGVQKDELKARLLLQKGCDGGVKAACAEVQRMNAAGVGQGAPPPAPASSGKKLKRNPSKGGGTFEGGGGL